MKKNMQQVIQADCDMPNEAERKNRARAYWKKWMASKEVKNNGLH